MKEEDQFDQVIAAFIAAMSDDDLKPVIEPKPVEEVLVELQAKLDQDYLDQALLKKVSFILYAHHHPKPVADEDGGLSLPALLAQYDFGDDEDDEEEREAMIDLVDLARYMTMEELIDSLKPCPVCHRCLDKDDKGWPVRNEEGIIVEGGCTECWEAQCAEGFWEAADDLKDLPVVQIDTIRDGCLEQRLVIIHGLEAGTVLFDISERKGVYAIYVNKGTGMFVLVREEPDVKAGSWAGTFSTLAEAWKLRDHLTAKGDRHDLAS